METIDTFIEQHRSNKTVHNFLVNQHQKFKAFIDHIEEMEETSSSKPSFGKIRPKTRWCRVYINHRTGQFYVNKKHRRAMF
uniref:Uncharacterized protein n=1 Tax=viral metagenome TaxID=1070528 RepID=A0A6C0CQG2_9ZZZZ